MTSTIIVSIYSSPILAIDTYWGTVSRPLWVVLEDCQHQSFTNNNDVADAISSNDDADGIELPERNNDKRGVEFSFEYWEDNDNDISPLAEQQQPPATQSQHHVHHSVAHFTILHSSIDPGETKLSSGYE